MSDPTPHASLPPSRDPETGRYRVRPESHWIALTCFAVVAALAAIGMGLWAFGVFK